MCCLSKREACIGRVGSYQRGLHLLGVPLGVIYLLKKLGCRCTSLSRPIYWRGVGLQDNEEEGRHARQ